METIVLITGGFDPLHSGHIAYINAAAELGDRLIIGLNSDDWLKRKKGKEFLPWTERAAILGALKNVDEVIFFNDDDGTAIDAIVKVKERYGQFDSVIIFANGGDRTQTNTPEALAFVGDNSVRFMYGVGGSDKINSSSKILENWTFNTVFRQWGWYKILYEAPGIKVKEIFVEPGRALSMQRHQHRAEHWVVVEGAAIVRVMTPDKTKETDIALGLQSEYSIAKTQWHKLMNPYAIPCKIIEIQFGNLCVEEDIERF